MEQYVPKVMPFTTAPCPRGLAEIDRIYRSCSFLKKKHAPPLLTISRCTHNIYSYR